MALDQGLIHPQTLLPDSPRSFGGYDPENFDRVFRGPLPAHEALRASRNLPAILLASQLRPGFYGFLLRAGVDLPFSADHYGLSLVLGGAEVSMRELGGLYAMLANKGVWRHPRLYEGEAAGSAVPLLSPEAAVVTLRMLEDDAHFVRSKEGPVPAALQDRNLQRVPRRVDGGRGRPLCVGGLGGEFRQYAESAACGRRCGGSFVHGYRAGAGVRRRAAR